MVPLSFLWSAKANFRMAELKTKPGDQSVQEFIQSVDNLQRRTDAELLLHLFNEVTGLDPVMWGPAIVGYGTYHYKYDSGREGDWMITGFSPRKQNMSVYIMDGFDAHASLLEKLGKYKTGSSCLYVNRLTDIDLAVLKKIIAASVKNMKKKYPAPKGVKK
ncbi:MAG: hypothetical protein RL220_804 [Bacteroidota bacterium]|jgi:hypothetical protein